MAGLQFLSFDKTIGIVNKFDQQGNSLIEKTITAELDTSIVTRRVLVHNNEIFITGRIGFFEGDFPNNDIYISKLDSQTGNTSWTVRENILTGNNYATDLLPLTDGSLIVAGTAGPSDSPELQRAFLMKINNDLTDTEDEIQPTFQLSPNPTEGLVRFINGENIINALSLHNSEGKLLIYQNDADPIDLSSYPDGSYIMRINTEQGLVTKKIIKL